MGLAEYFLNDFETSPVAKDQRLLSHTYSNDYNTVQNAASDAFKQVGIKLINVDNNYHEMLFEYKKSMIILTLIELSLYEVRVDIKVNTKYLLAFKRPIKLIDKLYELLDKRLTLKHKGGSNE